jgi:hypothetical protein
MNAALLPAAGGMARARASRASTRAAAGPFSSGRDAGASAGRVEAGASASGEPRVAEVGASAAGQPIAALRANMKDAPPMRR